MNHIELPGTSPFDAIRRTDDQGEYWTGRELMEVMRYSQWRDFATVLEKAKTSLAVVQGDDAADRNFAEMRKVSGARGPASVDVRLTRFGAYLTAMAGDHTKQTVAEARIYFAVKTREAEVAIPQQRTELSRRDLAEMVIAEADRADAAEALAAELAPDADHWRVLASADGDYSVADAAKLLSRDPNIKTGRNRLFVTLGELGWAYRQAGDNAWRVYQSAIESGRLSEIPQSHYHPRTGELVLDPPQIRVTAKGLADLRVRLGGSKALAA